MKHDYDDMVVVQGRHTLIICGDPIPLPAGKGYFIPRGVPYCGEVEAGTRAIHAFGGHRVERIDQVSPAA